MTVDTREGLVKILDDLANKPIIATSSNYFSKLRQVVDKKNITKIEDLQGHLGSVGSVGNEMYDFYKNSIVSQMANGEYNDRMSTFDSLSLSLPFLQQAHQDEFNKINIPDLETKAGIKEKKIDEIFGISSTSSSLTPPPTSELKLPTVQKAIEYLADKTKIATTGQYTSLLDTFKSFSQNFTAKNSMSKNKFLKISQAPPLQTPTNKHYPKTWENDAKNMMMHNNNGWTWNNMTMGSGHDTEIKEVNKWPITITDPKTIWSVLHTEIKTNIIDTLNGKSKTANPNVDNIAGNGNKGVLDYTTALNEQQLWKAFYELADP